MIPPERLSSELLVALAGGMAGVLGCFASSPAAIAAETKLKTPTTGNNNLRIDASTMATMRGKHA